MDGEKLYSLDDIYGLLLNLDNRIDNPCQGAKDKSMPTRIKEKVTVNGRVRWIDGYSKQEVFDNYVRLLVKEGIIEYSDNADGIPIFGEYMDAFYSTFKQKQEQNTVINRQRIIRNHVKPTFGDKRIDRIRTTDLQKWFNELGKQYSRETLLKIKNIMNPVFESAIEDEYITRNPLASKRLELAGKETIHHKAIPKEKMDEIKQGLDALPEKEKLMGALLSYTGMRYEEVLGIRWEDIDDKWVTVQRAVVHPKRNMPEIKAPKTKTSKRLVPLHPDLKRILGDTSRRGFVLATDKDRKHETPLSYTEARRVFDKIRKAFGITGYSAHDFRDTCATEWRENGIPLDVIARMLGHSKTETTEKRYVKYRTEMMENVFTVGNQGTL